MRDSEAQHTFFSERFYFGFWRKSFRFCAIFGKVFVSFFLSVPTLQGFYHWPYPISLGFDCILIICFDALVFTYVKLHERKIELFLPLPPNCSEELFFFPVFTFLERRLSIFGPCQKRPE